MRTGITIGLIVAGAGVIAVAETFRRKAAEANDQDPYVECHDFAGLEHHSEARGFISGQLQAPRADY